MSGWVVSSSSKRTSARVSGNSDCELGMVEFTPVLAWGQGNRERLKFGQIQPESIRQLELWLEQRMRQAQALRTSLYLLIGAATIFQFLPGVNVFYRFRCWRD